MKSKGLRNGDEVTVLVKINRKHVAELVVQTISNVEVSTGVYINEEDDLLKINEGMSAALSAVRFYMAKPNLKKMLRERIAELKRESEEEEDEVPSPDDYDDIPF